VGQPTAETVIDALREIDDPEVPIGIVDLGLIRNVRIEGGRVTVEIAFTSLGCPCRDLLMESVRERLLLLPGVEDVRVEEVFHRWSAADISSTGLRVLRVHGIT
jgi:metal-sulfur cluster biosynthetic enzyme